MASSKRSSISADTRPTADQQDHLLTIDEAAAYLNVPARWVAEAVRQHRIRCTRIGKHVRFRIAHLEELIVAGEQPVLEEVMPRQRSRRSKL
ncbi:MAG: helix-turn-helix domain-containing protein [Actinomycetota bacterium]|nr:helix-turn-helix domain-containing protein [Actinomycetota bacterium]